MDHVIEPRAASVSDHTGQRRGPSWLSPAGIWRRWMVLARFIGNVQARVLLTVFYFLVVPPFALVVKLRRDPLSLEAHRGATGWLERLMVDTSADIAGRQF